ncbi:hypothetical protein HDV00_001882 [Rhizophlyctis rosea]|nr:hypothetical protein HDV00_001882 [Rhizophlyctis rosea]
MMEQDEEPTYIVVRLVLLEKGTLVKLAPMDVDYLDISDMRSTLESHMRKHYATLTQGETLTISYLTPSAHTPKQYHFLITDLHPSPACLIIDTDLEVDIAPLDESLAEEAVKRKFASKGTYNGAGSTGGRDLVWQQEGGNAGGAAFATVDGAVEKDVYHYYRVPTQAEHKFYTIELVPTNGDKGDADLFVSTQTEQPTMMDHEYYNVDMGRSILDVSLPIDTSDSPFLYIGIHGYAPSTTFTLRITPHRDAPPPRADAQSSSSTGTVDSAPPGPDYAQCPNCHTYVPTRTLPMHRAFCERNNTLCGWCGKVMKKEDLPRHWHCEEAGCEAVGDVSEREKHREIVHVDLNCVCGASMPLPKLSVHRRERCPERLIVCRFCHLRVRAGGMSFSAKDLMLGTGLTEHESECGARTITCVRCSRNVQMKEVQAHMRLHEEERRHRKLGKELCRNEVCANWQAEKGENRNVLGVCGGCFGPFWTGRVDEGNKKLVQKMFGVYHEQLTKGCGRVWCQNPHCATSNKEPMEANEAAVKSLELFKGSLLAGGNGKGGGKYWFCVSDPVVGRRKGLAGDVSGVTGVGVEWCVRGLEVCGDDVEKAVEWVEREAPRVEK